MSGDDEPRDPEASGDPNPLSANGIRYRPNRAQWMVAGAIAAFGVGWVLYHVIKGVGLGQSAALYVGIPLVLAVILALSSPAARPAEMALKVTTILLLLSIPVLGEGACCVLLAAPIFYLFVYLGTQAVHNARARRMSGPSVFVLPVLLAAMALEGTTSWLSVPGDATAGATRIVDLPADRVPAALSAPMRFADVHPGGVLAIGFPDPVTDTGGLDVGARRIIAFSGAHHRSGPTVQHHWGTRRTDLVLAVSARTPTSVTFTPVSDATPLATWLRWRSVRVSWEPVDAGHTRLRWELDYTRLLAPSWYFAPIESVVTGRAADYLLRAVDVGAGELGTPPLVGRVHA